VEANRALGLPDDARDYADAADILGELGVRQVLLLTNNPTKITDLEAHGIAVVDRVPLNITPNPRNAHYIRTKQERMGHFRPIEYAVAQD
jgi:GTP cyclohydrolase II